MKRLFLPVSIILIFFASCYYDNEEALYPYYNTGCDTLNVTYSKTIVTIFSNNCYTCHSNANAASFGGNVHLESYNDVVAKQPNITGAIKHTGKYSPMPKNGSPLKPCYINQWDIWVRMEMPNN